MKLTKQQKLGAGIVGGILVVGGTVLGVKKARKNKQKNEFYNQADVLNLKVTPGGRTPPAFPIQYGHRGDNVKRLQVWLNKQIGRIAMIVGTRLPRLKEDGIFGKNTLKAVRAAFKSDKVTKEMFNKNKM